MWEIWPKNSLVLSSEIHLEAKPCKASKNRQKLFKINFIQEATV